MCYACWCWWYAEVGNCDGQESLGLDTSQTDHEGALAS